MLARVALSFNMSLVGRSRNWTLQEVEKVSVLNLAKWLQQLPAVLCQGYGTNRLNSYVVTKGTEISHKRTRNSKLFNNKGGKGFKDSSVPPILSRESNQFSDFLFYFFGEWSVNGLLSCIPCMSVSKVSYPFYQLTRVIHLSHLFPIKARFLSSWPRFALYFLDLNQKSYRQATNRWKK